MGSKAMLADAIASSSNGGGGVDKSLFLLLVSVGAIGMLVLIIILVFIACKFKPWRLLNSSSARSSRARTNIKADDLERPLVAEDLNVVESQSNEIPRSHALEAATHEGIGHHTQGGFGSPRPFGVSHKQRHQSASPLLTHSDSFVLDIPDTSEDALVGQTLKRPFLANQQKELKQERQEDLKYNSRFDIRSDSLRESLSKDKADQRSILMLEVISGPSQGLRYSIQSTNTSKLPLAVGRVAPSDLLLKDSEVSGRHALINWNLNKLKWELVDMGSLNGTLLNSQPIHHPQTGSRHWGDPVELANGDTITLGTTSKLYVQITSQTECQIPFGVGIAADPMALRRGGRKLPMEDVCFYQWPLSGTNEFGLFGICDGHGGAGGAASVSKILPEVIASILADSVRREKVLSQCNASDVLKEAFFQTEESIDHYYEGCTATVLLIWSDSQDNIFAQCANVGDSACVVHMDGKQVKMTEDHRISSYSERLRMEAMGQPLKDGETRLCGINLARMLGDKFLKQQDVRFSSEPYISPVVCIHQGSRGFALLASDGFWDVVNSRKAVQLVHQGRDWYSKERENPAEKMANFLLNEARAQRTKDNTSIIFVDFDLTSRSNPCKLDP